VIGILFCSSLWACGTNKDDRFIFFLHNRFLEEHDLNKLHPKFGRTEYNEIIAEFEKTNLRFSVKKERKRKCEGKRLRNCETN